MIVLKKTQDVVMNVLNKFIYYIPRLVHIVILPILYIGILWYPKGRDWEIVGLIFLAAILFYPLIMKSNKKLLFYFSCLTYIAIIGLFFPKYLLSKSDFWDYRNIIFFDMLLLFISDTYAFLKKENKWF